MGLCPGMGLKAGGCRRGAVVDLNAKEVNESIIAPGIFCFVL
ncbi:hypothetical protein NC653_000906 [Populus alba x Populus x berolinensis]|uniref:Uncharacterized protein n=1 Tax=Populus alba x Populus x berolinensis TaxID=444605 RepID=A0AAD6RK74_9ROSI|nr:hypothetical protein NC653_000906 [Populus alba x Populus x berolinensis]